MAHQHLVRVIANFHNVLAAHRARTTQKLYVTAKSSPQLRVMRPSSHQKGHGSMPASPQLAGHSKHSRAKGSTTLSVHGTPRDDLPCGPPQGSLPSTFWMGGVNMLCRQRILGLVMSYTGTSKACKIKCRINEGNKMRAKGQRLVRSRVHE